MRGLKTMDLFKQELSHQDKLYHLTDAERAGIQALLLETLEDVKSVCDKYQIPYMAGGGTALGAVRHQGYIPWDDDLDLNVERRYIRRLLDGIEEAYPNKYRILEPMKTEGYLSSFIQVQRKGTVMQEFLWQKEEECGIKMDIFVIENTFDSRIRRFWHRIGTDAGLFFLSCYRTRLWREEFIRLAEDKASARRVIQIKAALGVLYLPAPKFFYGRLQKRMKKCKDSHSKYVVIPTGRGHFGGELYERSAYCDTMDVPFEDTTISITKDYDGYLRRLYGDDYMVLPPEKEREAHVLYGFRM